MGTAVS